MKLVNKIGLLQALGLDPRILISASILITSDEAVTISTKSFVMDHGNLIEVFKEFELVEKIDA